MFLVQGSGKLTVAVSEQKKPTFSVWGQGTVKVGFFCSLTESLGVGNQIACELVGLSSCMHICWGFRITTFGFDNEVFD